jgi:hypothetical protein
MEFAGSARISASQVDFFDSWFPRRYREAPMTDANVNYEKMPAEMRKDETDVNLRSYFARQSDERLAEYDPSWSDEQVMEWDDNFTSDGNLFLPCSERDVEIEEFRQVLEEHLNFRGIARK